ncbi:hypothetical protein VTI28DRAFT_5802 [Corynascus sepedonium]
MSNLTSSLSLHSAHRGHMGGGTFSLSQSGLNESITLTLALSLCRNISVWKPEAVLSEHPGKLEFRRFGSHARRRRPQNHYIRTLLQQGSGSPLKTGVGSPTATIPRLFTKDF